jgi:hypothetical protein
VTEREREREEEKERKRERERNETYFQTVILLSGCGTVKS